VDHEHPLPIGQMTLQKQARQRGIDHQSQQAHQGNPDAHLHQQASPSPTPSAAVTHGEGSMSW
jgi:hypothetical protein